MKQRCLTALFLNFLIRWASTRLFVWEPLRRLGEKSDELVLKLVEDSVVSFMYPLDPIPVLLQFIDVFKTDFRDQQSLGSLYWKVVSGSPARAIDNAELPIWIVGIHLDGKEVFLCQTISPPRSSFCCLLL